jgi:murein L,D-transpeptidase YafK
MTFAQAWLPLLPGGDRALIKYERSQRLLRAEFGLPMPGEPDLARLPQRLAANGLKEGAPVLIRIFKREFELELWMQRDGVFHRFATYPICRWSGQLGPKLQQGDRQAPEGFYTVDATALNPNSSWHRSFNLGYPNAFDRANGRTGSLIMVHGGCASVGCFAMTNAQVDEIWRLVTGALASGQKRFQVQVYPFRMTDEHLADRAQHRDVDFWKNLKAGNDLFEKTLLPPKAMVCQGRYRFEPGDKSANGDIPIEDRCPVENAKS